MPAVTPACQWVADGEGVATRKWDGVCVMLDEAGQWWARREVKPGRAAPAGFVLVGEDPETGKVTGWEPSEQVGWWKYLSQALDLGWGRQPGTYELCGPKVNGNPERLVNHVLVRHSTAEVYRDAPRTFDGLAVWLAGRPIEGLVWHHPDGRAAKIKLRDFGYRRPQSSAAPRPW